MGRKYLDEEYHQMTLDEVFQEEVTPSLFAVSRIFADCRKQMNLAEYKTLCMALSKVDWTSDCPETLYCLKDDLCAVIGITSDIDHRSVDLNRAIGTMPNHSFLQFKDKDKDIYDNGNFVRRITFFKNRVRIVLEPEYLSLFGGLDKGYITMWSGDVYKMTSENAVVLYEFLRNESDTRLPVNDCTIGITKLKELFNIPKDGKGSYMRSAQNGGFDRTSFERKVIDPVCEELTKTEMIHLLIQSDGKFYEKIKQGNRVRGYKFFWTISNPKPVRVEKKEEAPEVIDMEEPKEAELWESALDDFSFNRLELDAIGERLRLVNQSVMFSNGQAYGSLDLDRYHFMSMRASDLKAIDSKTPIKNKFKYLCKMIEDYIPKGVKK